MVTVVDFILIQERMRKNLSSYLIHIKVFLQEGLLGHIKRTCQVRIKFSVSDEKPNERKQLDTVQNHVWKTTEN